MLPMAKNFTDETPHAVAGDGIADIASADGHAQAGMPKRILTD
jgi:hypothetical protein